MSGALTPSLEAMCLDAKRRKKKEREKERERGMRGKEMLSKCSAIAFV